MGAARTFNKELLEQYILAGSAETSPEKLRVLAEHFCDKIRMRVAENPATPKDVLQNLANDQNIEVRLAAAFNTAWDESLIWQLARDADISVRHRLAQNIDLPRVVLEELAQDDNGWVRGEALKSLAILDSKSGDEVGRRRSRKRSRAKMIRDHEEHAEANQEVAS